MPVKPTSEPTERSMLRETITSTMPVAITATDAVCTDRFQRLREVRNVPLAKRWNGLAPSPDMNWKPSQTTASAMTMPRRRVSISVAWMNPRRGLSPPSRVRWGAGLVISAMPMSTHRLFKRGARGDSGAADDKRRRKTRSEFRLAAGLHRACLDALADLVLADPLGIDHEIEVVLGDRHRGEQDGGHLDL